MQSKTQFPLFGDAEEGKLSTLKMQKQPKEREMNEDESSLGWLGIENE